MDVDIAPGPMSEDEDEGQDDPPGEDMQVEKDHDGTASDNEDEDQQAVNDVLMGEAAPAAETVDPEQPFIVPDAPEPPTFTMKVEEIEGADALHLAERSDQGSGDSSSLQPTQSSEGQWNEHPKVEAMDTSDALKEGSNNPTLNSQPEVNASAPEVAAKEQKSLLTPEQAKTLRSSLLSLPDEALFVTLDQFVALSDEQLSKSLAPEGGSVETDPAFDWTVVFPELQAFSLIDVPNSEIVGNGSSDGRRKSDKKADKDDPTKRVEETTYTKLCPTNRFMHIKPVLVSALQPAKKWRKGKWIDLDESPVMSDVDSPASLHGAENTCGEHERLLYSPHC